MEIIVFLSIVIAVVAVLTSIFLVRRVKKQIAEMTDALVDVKNGNGNRRILSATNEDRIRRLPFPSFTSTSASVISAICFFTRRMRTMEVNTATTAITMDKNTIISMLTTPPY